MNQPNEIQLPSIDGPHAPELTRAMADTAQETVRWLNHATGNHVKAGLEFPSDVDYVLGCLHSAAYMRQQLYTQLAGWLIEQDADGQVALDSTAEQDSPVAAVLAVQAWLRQAKGMADQEAHMLGQAARITSHLAAS